VKVQIRTIAALGAVVTAACGTDFSLVGGSAALDGLAVKQRVSCLLPDFDAQVVMPQNDNSALQIYPITFGHSYSPYAGYYQWLLQKYPDSKSAVGIVWGQSPITQIDSVTAAETLKAEGAANIYNDVFPVTGASDWICSTGCNPAVTSSCSPLTISTGVS